MVSWVLWLYMESNRLGFEYHFLFPHLFGLQNIDEYFHYDFEAVFSAL